MEVSLKYREIAYKIWRDNGQHIVNTVKILNRDHDYEITRQSLAKWRDEYEWEGRAARAEAAEKDRADAISDSSILDSLIEQRGRYEVYFKTLPPGKVDNAAIWPYNSVLKTIIDIKDKIEAKRKEGIKSESIGLGVSRPIKTSQEATFALQDAIEYKLNMMLSQPDSFSMKAAKEIKAALELVEDMKAKYVPKDTDKTQKGLTKPTIDEMKARLLGLIT